MNFGTTRRSTFVGRLTTVCGFSFALFITASAAAETPSRSFVQLATPVSLINLEHDYFGSAQNRYNLTITNRSDWSIDEVYCDTSENAKSSTWGRDWLGEATLDKNEFMVIKSLKPGEYDVKFVDEDEDECILQNIAITKNTSWVITSAWLEKCIASRK